MDISPPQAKIEGSQNITRAFGESISLRGMYSDNWNVVSVKWYLGESLVLTDPSPQKEGESVFDLEILIDQVQAGTHTIRMEVTDASGMTSNSTSNLTIYDATPPSVNNAIVEITRFTDETITLEALAVDLESESLGYSWDVDVNIDSDGDGITNNDMDRSGQTLTVTYEKAGIYSLICTVTNDNGLETNIEYIIAIESAQTTPSLIDQIMPYLPIIGAISLVLLIAAGLILIISIRARKKMKEIEEELRNQEQEQMQVPSESEQKEMFARNRDDGQSSFSYRRSPTTEISADPDIAALLGRKPSDMAQSRNNKPNDDLLSLMFEEENDEGEDATTDSENDKTERSRPQIPQIPTSEEIPGPSSISGSERNDINEEEQPTDDQPSPGDAEELVQDLQMRVKCSECQAQFRVKIPDGAPGVRASCPTCGSLQVVRRP